MFRNKRASCSQAQRCRLLLHGVCYVHPRTLQLQAYDSQDTTYLDPTEFADIEQEILAFSIVLNEENTEVKLKLSQNKSAADFHSTIEHLKASGQTELVNWMIQKRRTD